ncbi:hypothetical protein BZA05DRAFT_22147 [Tricharina praecox]|uniref:uncharacterized protein n=1 Tax=Tricharina praecox TaxID=43433 RepID=UPI0022204427|nr:uncharacterized protein BZA05DRAFT_22147 [Tricharina praecox]KAI5859129.1 hypothetical protein BZA05DRAFT_22147 [Tricharina praecox]
MPSTSHPSTPNPRKQTIIFLGAPILDRINLEESNLEDVDTTNPRRPLLTAPDSTSAPKWRVLHASKRLKTGYTQSFTADSPSASAASAEPEHSYGHTQRGDASDAGDDDSAFLSTASSTFSSYLDASTILPTPSADLPLPPLPPLDSLTSLDSLPPARLISPASRVTLLVGIIAITPTRTITTRYRKKATVTTLTVGDFTLAPFRIDIWLPCHPQTVDEMELRAVVQELRVLDVVVVKHCRLGVFKEQIFGTAGSKGVGGSEIWVLHRIRCVDTQERRRWKWRWGEGLVERRLQRTAEWVTEFGGGPEVMIGGRGKEEEMPQDTPGNVSF